MSKKVPHFRTEQEEARFWDTHDTTEYLEEFEDDTETVFVRPENGIVEVNPETWREVLRAAKKQRTSPSRLVNRWLKEKLARTE